MTDVSARRHRGRLGATPVLLAALLCLQIACEVDEREPGPAGPSLLEASALAQEVRALTAARGIGPLERTARVRPELVRLGQALAFDKILSGNKDISCMTCHLPGLGTGDARSLSIGQGATGLGVDRVHPAGEFIPRNAPPAFNLFAHKVLFWDGRITIDESGRLHTPAEERVTA